MTRFDSGFGNPEVLHEPQLVGKTQNGFNVFVDPIGSHASTHMKNHPELLEYVKEILSQTDATADEIRFETDMGRTVGMSDAVETSALDDVFYELRPNRTKYSRFVRNKSAEPTPFVTIDLRKKDDQTYDLYTSYIGRKVPSFPEGKEDLNEEGRVYWNSHALAVGAQKIVAGSETGADSA